MDLTLHFWEDFRVLDCGVLINIRLNTSLTSVLRAVGLMSAGYSQKKRVFPSLIASPLPAQKRHRQVLRVALWAVAIRPKQDQDEVLTLHMITTSAHTFK